MPFDVRRILEQADHDWLPESWSDPDGFTAALVTASVGRGPPPKSRLGQHHDFFHDLVVRHAGTDLIALRTWNKTQGWKTLGYRQLHEQATRRAAAWARQGVKPGARLCLLYHPGPELLVSLAAALGLGACISYLPPQGRAFLSRRLTALAPEHIAAEPHQALLFEGFEKLLLRVQDTGTPAFTSHSYKPADPVGLVFSPLADPPDVPVPLTADDAWRGALVDGLLTFGLGPGEHLAAPGFHPLQHLPALLFATMMRGATFLHLDPADLETNPTPLTEHPVRSLGVTPGLRDLLLRTRTPLKNVAHWFRNPEEPLDWERWRDWVKQSGLFQVPSSNVLVDSAAGGAVLCSRRRVGDIHVDAPPAAGRRWMLRDLNQSGMEAPGDVGLFTLLPDKDRPLPYLVLSRVHGQYYYGGTREARREGRVYPATEVIEVLESLPSLRGTSVLAVPTGGSSGQFRHVLLAFTGAASPENTPAQRDIRRCIELQLGAEHLPDRLELFPLYPHRVKGKLDEKWCHSQYLTGALHKKTSDALFQALTALRGQVLDTDGKPGDDGPAPPA